MAGLEAGLGLWEEVVDEEAEIAVLPTTDEGTSTLHTSHLKPEIQKPKHAG